MRIPVYTVTFHLFILFSIYETGLCDLTCLSCESVALPRICREIVKCGSHEVCGLEQYITPIGSIRYRQKCMDKLMCASKKREILSQDRSDRSVTSTICMSCCDRDLCNSGGCSQKGFEDALTGRLCYSCGSQIGSNACNVIEPCSRDQICRISPLDIHDPGVPKNLFKTECQHIQNCAAELAIIGRKRSGCHTCCNGTLCNDYDPAGNCAGPSTTTQSSFVSSTASTSAAAATTTAAVTQAPAVTTTSHSVTSGSQSGSGSCKDVMKVCPKAFCTLDAYKDWVKLNCKQTCGLCTDVGAHTGPALACQDLTSGCTDVYCHLPEYLSWTKSNCKKTCGFCTVHASANEGDGWFLMFKAVAGVPFPSPDISSIWAGQGTLNANIPAYANFSNHFKGHFKPDFADHWDQMHFDKVTVSMYINGTAVASITFNSTGLDKLSWFRADRVTDSSWAQQPGSGQFQMSLTDTTGFEFNAEIRHGGAAGCDSTGWMTVVANSNCVHDSKLHVPAFLYCPGQQTCRWRDNHYMSAEVLAIHAHSTV